MSAALKLSDNLSTNVPVNLIIQKRVGEYPETHYKTKEPTGKKIFLYVFRDNKGQEFKHYAKEREEEILSVFNPSEEIVAVRKETFAQDGKRIYYIDWTPKEGAEAELAKTPTLRSNVQQNTQEKQIDNYEYLQRIKNKSIGLRGIVQAQIASGKTGPEITGDNGFPPSPTAIQWDEWIEQKAKDLIDFESI